MVTLFIALTFFPKVCRRLCMRFVPPLFITMGVGETQQRVENVAEKNCGNVSRGVVSGISGVGVEN